MRIVVLDGFTLNPGDNPWDEVARLGDLTVHDRTPADLIVERSAGAEILLTNKTPLSAATLEQLPDCRFISVLATGYNIVDVDAAARRGIPVSNVPIYGTDSVAQHVFALILNLLHRPQLHDQLIRDGEWVRRQDFCFWESPLVELRGKKMGIVGFGRIGRRVGEIANVLGMEVLAFDVFQGNPPPYEPFAWVDLEQLFAEADVVSLHCPQTEENTGMVNKGLLGHMKTTAFLINTARGGLVNEAELADALNSGKISGASLDVVSVEPIKPENPLLKARNCVLTPHIAWATREARIRLMRTTAENIAAFQTGQPINVVN